MVQVRPEQQEEEDRDGVDRRELPDDAAKESAPEISSQPAIFPGLRKHDGCSQPGPQASPDQTKVVPFLRDMNAIGVDALDRKELVEARTVVKDSSPANEHTWACQLSAATPS